MQGNELSLAITLLVECTARRELSLQQRILTLSGFTQEFGFGSARLTSQHAKLFLSSTTRLKPAAVNPPSSWSYNSVFDPNEDCQPHELAQIYYYWAIFNNSRHISHFLNIELFCFVLVCKAVLNRQTTPSLSLMFDLLTRSWKVICETH